MKNEILTNENKGFSLVELIVVIAIMAVMTSVLAPSLLGYVEQSRMAKDNSAMGEVTNAIKLALADQDVYDECLKYNINDNYSCYADSSITDFDAAQAIEDKNRKVSGAGVAGTVEKTDDWHYVDDTRLADEEAYHPDGKMRGMTITFVADASANEAMFKLASARVNEMQKLEWQCAKPIANNTKAAFEADTITTLGKMTVNGGTAADTDKKAAKLYNKLRAVIGDNITLSSQTYRNSEYTVFIRMGSMGGNDAAAQDAVAVYGQWSGTNLYEP